MLGYFDFFLAMYLLFFKNMYLGFSKEVYLWKMEQHPETGQSIIYVFSSVMCALHYNSNADYIIILVYAKKNSWKKMPYLAL